jgi:hypothetical protein
MPFGFSDEEWDLAKGELRRCLVAIAKRRQVIAYSDLVEQLEGIDFGPHDFPFFQMLDQISTEEDEKGRGLLTVVVVHKAGDMRPGPGFFELAEARGRDVEEIDKTWLAELDSVWGYWRDH